MLMKKIYYLLASLLLVPFIDAFGSFGSENGHDYIDLELPSGTLWATANVGANMPEAYGDYFAWGEIEPKKTYSWSNYKYGTNESSITKYCCDSVVGKDGFVDGKTMLEAADDVAHVKWGGRWTMPTEDQWKELSTQCYWVWTENYGGTGSNGYIVYKAKRRDDKGARAYKGTKPVELYSMSDVHIFLPATGCRFEETLSYSGSYGYYWASVLDTNEDTQYGALYVGFRAASVYHNYYYRYYGHAVRPVINK